MFLSVNVGNTHIAYGLFQGQNLVRTWRVRADPARTDDESRLLIRQLFAEHDLSPDHIRGCMISSVIPRLSHTLSMALEGILGTKPTILHHSLDLGIENRYHHPENVGADRLANAVGGVVRYGAPLIIVDLGTATTLDVVSRDRAYLGGVILPGLEMSADSLFQKTSLLPRIAIEPPERTIGRTTIEAITSGLLLGTAGAVDELTRRIREEMAEPNCPLIATGGHGPVISRISKEISKTDPDLTLFGILKIWERNQ